jgi:hypothetical protein
MEDRQRRKEDKEYANKISKIKKEFYKDSKNREKQSKAKKQYFKNHPEKLEKHKQMTKNTAKQRSEKMKANWENPAYIYKIMEARVGHDRALEIIEEKLGKKARRRFEEEL